MYWWERMDRSSCVTPSGYRSSTASKSHRAGPVAYPASSRSSSALRLRAAFRLVACARATSMRAASVMATPQRPQHPNPFSIARAKGLNATRTPGRPPLPRPDGVEGPDFAVRPRPMIIPVIGGHADVGESRVDQEALEFGQAPVLQLEPLQLGGDQAAVAPLLVPQEAGRLVGHRVVNGAHVLQRPQVRVAFPVPHGPRPGDQLGHADIQDQPAAGRE